MVSVEDEDVPGRVNVNWQKTVFLVVKLMNLIDSLFVDFTQNSSIPMNTPSIQTLDTNT